MRKHEAPIEHIRVLVWRTEWISFSETFIDLQARNTPRIKPFYVGRLLNDAGLRLGAVSCSAKVRLLNKLQGFALSRFGFGQSLRRFVEQNKVQIVHAHFGPDAVNIHKFCARNAIPLVMTLHGYDVSAMAAGDGRASRRYRRRLKAAMEYSSLVVCVSTHIRALALQLGSPVDSTVVHHIGVEMPLDKISSSGREGLLFVGRLVEKKGLDDLITALSLLPDDLRQVELSVMGTGPLREQLAQMALKLGVRVRFIGAAAHADVLAAVSKCRAIVVPSKKAANGDVEGLPTVITEAMARATPVVATNHSGIPDAVTHGVTGLLSEESNPRALANNLERILRNQEGAASMGLAAKLAAEGNFDASVQGSLLADLYAASLAIERRFDESVTQPAFNRSTPQH